MKFSDLEKPEVLAEPGKHIPKAEEDVLSARAAYDAADNTLKQAIDGVVRLNKRMGALQSRAQEAREKFETAKTVAMRNEVLDIDTSNAWGSVTRAQNEARRAIDAIQFLATFTSEDAVRDKLSADLVALRCEAALGEAAGALMRLRLFAGAALLREDPGASIKLLDSDGAPTSESGRLARDVERLWQVEIPRLESALEAHDRRVEMNRADARATLFAI